jgi:hypothetical protein
MASEYCNNQVPSGDESYRLASQADYGLKYDNGPMVDESAVWIHSHTESEKNFFATNNAQGSSLSHYEFLASPGMIPVHDDTPHPYRHQPARSYHEDQSGLGESPTHADASSGHGHRSAGIRLGPLQYPLARGYDNRTAGVDKTVWRDTGPMEMNGYGQPTSPQVSHQPGWDEHRQAHSRVVAFDTVPDARQSVPSYHRHVDASGNLLYNRAQQLSGNPSLPHHNCPSDTNDAFSGRSVAPWSPYQVGRQEHQPSLNAAISRCMRQVPASSSADSSDYQPGGNALVGSRKPTMTDSFNSDIQDLMQSHDTIRPDDTLARRRSQASTSMSDHSNSGAALYEATFKGDALEDSSYYDLCENTEILDSTVSDEYQVASSST